MNDDTRAKPALLVREQDSEQDVSQLLKEIDAANAVADGMDAKLDQLLGSLDQMLATLEKAQETKAENARKEERPVAETVQKS